MYLLKTNQAPREPLVGPFLSPELYLEQIQICSSVPMARLPEFFFKISYLYIPCSW